MLKNVIRWPRNSFVQTIQWVEKNHNNYLEEKTVNTRKQPTNLKKKLARSSHSFKVIWNLFNRDVLQRRNYHGLKSEQTVGLKPGNNGLTFQYPVFQHSHEWKRRVLTEPKLFWWHFIRQRFESNAFPSHGVKWRWSCSSSRAPAFHGTVTFIWPPDVLKPR